MLIQCSQCGQQLTADESIIGQLVQCPTCKASFTAALPPAGQASPAIVTPGMPASSPGMLHTSGLPALLVATAGALLLIVSFLVPWWSITITPPGRDSRSSGPFSYSSRRSLESEIESNAKRLVKYTGWYVEHSYVLDVEDLSDIKDMAEKGSKWSCRIWGPQCAGGITSFVLGLAIVGASVLTMIPRAFSGTRWVASLVLAAMAIPPFIMSLAWSSSTPGVNIEGLLEQGNGAGPWLALAGAVVVIAGCGLFGAQGLIKCLSKNAEA